MGRIYFKEKHHPAKPKKECFFKLLLKTIQFRLWQIAVLVVQQVGLNSLKIYSKLLNKTDLRTFILRENSCLMDLVGVNGEREKLLANMGGVKSQIVIWSLLE